MTLTHYGLPNNTGQIEGTPAQAERERRERARFHYIDMIFGRHSYQTKASKLDRHTLQEMAPSRVFNLIQVTIIVFVIIAAVEYFKYSTKMNYEWFHCTPQLSIIPNTGITQVVAVGGPSCDKRGQLKSITKKIAASFDPNVESVLFCIKEDESNGVIGYAAKTKDEVLLSEGYCSNVIHW